MLINEIDWTKKYDFTLVLTKRNKKPIAILHEASERYLEVNLDTLNKLTFTIPKYIKDNLSNNKIENPNYDKVIEENMILLKCGEASNPVFEAYFIIKQTSESSDKMSKQIQCSSREVMLNKNLLTLDGIERQLKKDEVNVADGIFDIIEQESTWRLGHLDESAKVEHINGGTSNKYRWFDSFSKPTYQFISEDVQNAFNVVVMYDTVNKLINVYDRDSYGINTGIILSEENYIKNLNKMGNSESIVTKLEVTGRDGITFEDVNPLGTTYVLNYDYFRNNGLMSEELMSALDKYDILLNNKNVEFQNVRTQIDDIDAQLVIKQSEMTTLNEQLVALKHIQSAYMASNDNVNLPTATANVNNKVIEIANKKAEIDNLNSQKNDLGVQLSAIAYDIDKKNAKDINGSLIFNSDLLEELEDFTYCESWEGSYYNNSTSLYKASLDTLKDWSIPTIEFSMDLIDFFGYVKAQKYWGKIKVGDFVRVFSKKLNTNVDVRIINYSYNIDSNDLKITFSNKNKKLNDVRNVGSNTRKTVEASKLVNAKKLDWNKIKTVKDAVDVYLNNALDTSRQSIISQVGKNKISIDENGIFCIDADNENNQIAILSSVIGFTSDGWQTANTCIDSTGIYANFLTGKILLGEQLFVSNADGTVELNGLGMTIKDEGGNLRVKIGKLDNGNYGISIVGKSGNVVLDDNGIIQTNYFVVPDNLDSENPIYLKFYVNENTSVVQNLKLYIMLDYFRSYEKGAQSNGSHRHMMFSYTGDSQSSSNAGTMTLCEYLFSYSYGGDFPLSTWIPITPHTETSYPVSDIYTASSDGSHAHESIYGIYKGAKASNVYIKVNGTTVATEINSDYDIDVAQYILTGSWNTIEIGSSTLGRIITSVYSNMFITT